jgi:hypothetical protein
VACGSASGVNRAWQSYSTDAMNLITADSCGGLVGGAEDGLFAVDRLPGPPNAPAGAEAGWRLTAPASARITRLVVQYYLGQRSAGEWSPFIRTSEGSTLQTCTPQGGNNLCERGAPNYDPFGPSSTFDVNAAGLEAGVRCSAPMGTCVNGSALHAAWTALYSARVRISESTPPTGVTATGSLWSDSYLRSIVTGSVAATDATGIRRARLLVDGTPRTSGEHACDFTLVVPCPSGRGASIVLDTRTLTDGPHQFTAVAEDAAGNTASISRPVVVDNSAPTAPTGLAVDGQATSAANAFTLRWQPPPGQVAPIAAVRWSLCPVSGAACTIDRRAGIDRLDALAVPAVGDWDLRVWLEDAAGNNDAARAAGPLRLSYRPTTQPAARDSGLRIRRVSRRGRIITVAGTAGPTSGRVTVTLQRTVGGQRVRLRGAVQVRQRRWSRRLRLKGRLARVRRISVVARMNAQPGYRADTAKRTYRR